MSDSCELWKDTTAKTITHGVERNWFTNQSSPGSQDQSSTTRPLGVGLPPHGLNLPPKDHYRRKGSGPRTLNTFVTVEDLPPFAIQSLRSERQRAYAFRCQRKLRKLLHFEHRFSSHAYRVVGGLGMARI